MAGQTFFITLENKRMIAPETLELRFNKPAQFSYVPGQFVQFHIPDGEKRVLRSFSLSSAPHHGHLEFCVKLLSDGKASAFFSALPLGGMAVISEARGRFVCDSVGSNYFIATGTGLAPILSMVSHLVESPQPTPTMVVGQAGTAVLEKVKTTVAGAPIHVLFGVRHAENLFWIDRLEALRLKNSNLSLKVSLSRPTEAWTGLCGRVSEHVAADPLGNYYICGSLEMVKDMRALLVKADVSPKQIHQEIF